MSINYNYPEMNASLNDTQRSLNPSLGSPYAPSYQQAPNFNQVYGQLPHNYQQMTFPLQSQPFNGGYNGEYNQENSIGNSFQTRIKRRTVSAQVLNILFHLFIVSLIAWTVYCFFPFYLSFYTIAEKVIQITTVLLFLCFLFSKKMSGNQRPNLQLLYLAVIFLVLIPLSNLFFLFVFYRYFPRYGLFWIITGYYFSGAIISLLYRKAYF